MTKLLITYYSSYGHIFEMAKAARDAAEDLENVNVKLARIPELEAARKAMSQQEAYVEAQKKLVEQAINEELSVRQMEELVRKYQEEKKKSSQKNQKQQQKSREEEAIYKSITSKLRNKLSTKVDIKSKKKGGEIRIAYYSDDELDRILRLFENI